MRIDDLIVEVRRPDLSRAGQLVNEDLAGSLFNPQFNDIGTWTLRLPARDVHGNQHRLCAELLVEGAGIIVTGPYGVILSGTWDEAEWEADARDSQGAWVFTGVSDLEDVEASLAWPDPAEGDASAQTVASDVRTAPAETLLHEYVEANIGPSAPVSRRNPKLQMGADLGRGPTRTASPRFDNLLTLCRTIVSDTDLAFDLVQVGDGLVFTTSVTNDRRELVRWDIDNEQLERAQNRRIAPRVTHAIVAGQGEGVERLIIERSSAASVASAAVWGRRERFIDQRQAEELTELQQAGDLEVASGGAVTGYYSVTPSTDIADLFGEEWNVGDIITAVIGEVEIPIRVAGAVISVTNQGVLVGAILGDQDAGDPESALVRTTADKVSKLERTAEVGGLPVGTHLAGEWSAGAVPPGFVLANGAVLNIADYPKLAAHYTAVYGSANHHGGNGTTTFAVPDTRERTYVNQGGTDIFATIGSKLGAKTHTLTVAQMPAHQHPFIRYQGGVADALATQRGNFGALPGSTVNTESAGGGQSHPIVQPSFVCRYVIRAV